MFDSIIIYPYEDHVAFCYPNSKCNLTLEQIAQKDVPAGVPYCFLPKSEVPTNSAFFDAFEYDFSNPDGYGMGSDAFYHQKGE
jgi:hypothetical protein